MGWDRWTDTDCPRPDRVQRRLAGGGSTARAPSAALGLVTSPSSCARRGTAGSTLRDSPTQGPTAPGRAGPRATANRPLPGLIERCHVITFQPPRRDQRRIRPAPCGRGAALAGHGGPAPPSCRTCRAAQPLPSQYPRADGARPPPGPESGCCGVGATVHSRGAWVNVWGVGVARAGPGCALCGWEPRLHASRRLLRCWTKSRAVALLNRFRA
jgi:hypothetical protein